ncbi:MAG: inosine/xanthosine triphosphatase [Thaumarchaeota archaeon]|nr:inosine/xanthosine triphosphatase [Nitrososphaerota archaeon]
MTGTRFPRAALVAIGSRNRAKTLGVRNVFLSLIPKCTFAEVDTSAVVRVQPMGMSQVIVGATRRAKFALKQAKADFGVGVEAGILRAAPRQHVNLQVAFIVDRAGNTGLGFSSGFLIPESFIARMKEQRKELDTYSHELTGAKKIAEEEGIVYPLTKGRVSRLQMTEQSVVMALVPWLNAATYGVQ